MYICVIVRRAYDTIKIEDMKLSRTAIIIVLLTALATAGCARKEQKQYSISGMVWNTAYHITYTGDRDLSDSIADVLNRVEMSLSPFKDNSLISRINRGENVKADPLTAMVFTASQQVSEASSGAFDPTLSPLINLWGFGYDNAQGEPTQTQIDSCMELVGILECRLNPDGTISKKSPGTTFNFSAITKGLGCNETARMLQRNGVNNYLIEIGGEIAAGGHNSEGVDWRIMVDAPVDSLPGAVPGIAVLNLTDCGVATSGNYRNHHRTADGKEIGHTISAATGRPYASNTLSATVIAPNAMLADALATTAMALEPEEALKVIDNFSDKTAVMLVTATPEGQIIMKSARFDTLGRPQTVTVQ